MLKPSNHLEVYKLLPKTNARVSGRPARGMTT
jgi:CO dehydrogenase/acetyl-CoA synthase gamma subunit (corrinoid Fe-S protein)